MSPVTFCCQLLCSQCFIPAIETLIQLILRPYLPMFPRRKTGNLTYRHPNVFPIIREAWNKFLDSSISVFLSLMWDGDGVWMTCCKALKHSQKVMWDFQRQRNHLHRLYWKGCVLGREWLTTRHPAPPYLSYWPLKPSITRASYTTSLPYLPSMLLFTSIPSLRTMSGTLSSLIRSDIWLLTRDRVLSKKREESRGWNMAQLGKHLPF